MPTLIERSPCGPRKVYIDAGASWCNTLTLFTASGVAPITHPWRVLDGAPWHVYAFEAAPLIMPFVERCCEAVSRDQRLPQSPVPPTASSLDLLGGSSVYAQATGCLQAARYRDPRRGNRTRVGYARLVECMREALERALGELTVQPGLSSDARLRRERLRGAATAGCPDGAAGHGQAISTAEGGGRAARWRARATFVPAAVGAAPGTVRLRGSRMQLLRGGAQRLRGHAADSARRRAQREGEGAVDEFVVAQVDLARWMLASFALDDHVVLKLDVEGAEREVVPALLATNASRLIDHFLWEPGHARNRAEAEAWEAALRAAGVRQIHRDPFPFQHEVPEWAELAKHRKTAHAH